MATIAFDHVYKIFGRDPEGALEMRRDGTSRKEIHEATGNVVAVDDVALEVGDGELFVVMGLSGSGKSTLVRLVNRLFEPTAGTVTIDGEDVGAMAPKRLRQLRAERISMVFQRFALFPHRNVLDNAGYGLRVRGVDASERERGAREALEMVGLDAWADSYPRELSGGMQQRVGLARALATGADVLLMDEPFSALDPLIRREIQMQLLELQERLGRTIVFITHDLNEAMLLGDRIAVMKDGAVVQIGTVSQLLDEPADDYVAAFCRDVDRSRVLTAAEVMREPAATLSPKDGPKTGIHLMQELSRSELYVIGPGGKVLGWVTDTDLARLRQTGGDTVMPVLRDDHPRTGPETPLVDLLDLAAAHTLPIAVVDDDGLLQGVIPRPMLLSALGGRDSGQPAGAQNDVMEGATDA